MNLAVNARDAMPDGGVVMIRLAAERVPPGDGDLEWTPVPAELTPGVYARISVSDNGKGMPPDVLARASEPFFTTQPRGRGTGLGLAGARGFAQGAGGGFHISSAVGVGTATVTLWLPEAVEQAGGPAGDFAPRVAILGSAQVVNSDGPLASGDARNRTWADDRAGRERFPRRVRRRSGQSPSHA